jgi:DNA-binding NtrC family response regulator/tetratricopeptide (TPR) repeat protein
MWPVTKSVSLDRSIGVPIDDRKDIEQLEERLALGPRPSARDAISELEMLADLYLQADSHVPALETIDRLLSLPAARTLSASRRAALESKAVTCRLAQGDCQAALAHCRDLLAHEESIDSLPMRAKIHLQCGEALFRLARFAEARNHAERAQSVAEQCADLSAQAASLNLLGRTDYRTGDLASARECYEHALALYRRLDDSASVAMVRNNLGLIHKTLCQWDEASADLGAALALYRRLGRFVECAHVLMNLGIVHQKRGDWPTALDQYRQAEEMYLQVSDQLRLAVAAIGQGNIARLERRWSDAETLLLSALERARSHGAAREEALALEFLGELDNDRGRPEAALGRLADAMRIAQRVAPEGDLVVEIERRRAEALVALSRLDEAESTREHAQTLARRTDDRLEYAVAQRLSGDIAWARGEREEAVRAWSLAVQSLRECNERLELGRVHLNLGRAVDEPREARRQFYLAGALFAPLSATYWLEQAESELQRVLGTAVEPAPARPASLLGRRHRAPSLVACSHAMHMVETLARRAATTELSVLITGETGTGKELIARTIHSLSSRAARPFLAVNCGALRADLALSQLFGHRKGAFTGAHAEGVGLVEAAHGGTLFLDEVGELPLDVQVTLLRFLESGEYLRLGETQVRRADVRVIAATNRELRGDQGERLFRRDLLFRLNEIEIRLPALRERSDDILPLARHFLAFYGGIDGPRLTRGAESVLSSYGWPGNVRELENVMKRLAALHGEGSVDAETLLPFLSQPVSIHGPLAPGATREDAERTRILEAIRQAHGNKSRVAELLGVSRKTLYARMKRLSIGH